VAGSGLPVSWDPITDWQLLFEFHFMQNAFLAGTIIALVAGVIGYYVVLRAQTFAAHALAHVGFTGAAGALLFGVSPIVGLLAMGASAAIGMGVLERRQGTMGAGDSVAIAAVFTFGLALGLLFLQLYSGQAENAYSILFGAVLGISDDDVVTMAVTGVVTLVVLGIISRPLLFSSLDPDVALAQGVPVRAVSILFLMLLGFAVAEAVQVVGTLLIFALVVTPAATARYLTARPSFAIVLSAALAVLFTWAGLAAAYFGPYSVAGFYITTFAFATYLLVLLVKTARRELSLRMPRRQIGSLA
jgi:zinc/manganese transport system permease protein